VEARRKAEERVTAQGEYVQALQATSKALLERIRAVEAGNAAMRQGNAAMRQGNAERIRAVEAGNAAMRQGNAAMRQEARAAGAFAETTSLAHDALALHGRTLVAAAEAASDLVATATAGTTRQAAGAQAVVDATAKNVDAQATLARAAAALETHTAAMERGSKEAVNVVLHGMQQLAASCTGGGAGEAASSDDGDDDGGDQGGSGTSGTSCGQEAAAFGFGGFG
jgi:hypothetical protein